MLLYVVLGLFAALVFHAWWRFNRRRPGEPPVVGSIPFFGCIASFATDSVGLVRQSYEKLGDCFTLSLVGYKMTFLVGPEAQ